MSNEEILFLSISEKYIGSDPNIHMGKMMSAPALKYDDKVFSFFNKGAMGFRLGGNFDPKKFGVLNPKPLSPFKTKPPLKGWVIIEGAESSSWETLTGMALEFTKGL